MASTRSRELAALCGQLAQWRKHGGGGRGKRIPDGVWQQAAAVARVDGVLATARATRLNLERLQACVAAAEATPALRGIARRQSGRQGDEALARSHAQPQGPQFVSVQLAPSARRPALTIELISRSGERMRIESADGLDVADVVHSFWSRRA
jgi:hypothetical protein